MILMNVFDNIIANYAPYVIFGVLAIVYIWTLSEPTTENSDGNNGNNLQKKSNLHL